MAVHDGLLVLGVDNLAAPNTESSSSMVLMKPAADELLLELVERSLSVELQASHPSMRLRHKLPGDSLCCFKKADFLLARSARDTSLSLASAPAPYVHVLTKPETHVRCKIACRVTEKVFYEVRACQVR